MATPLLLALAVIEISDVAFAVDSIPAVRIDIVSATMIVKTQGAAFNPCCHGLIRCLYMCLPCSWVMHGALLRQ